MFVSEERKTNANFSIMKPDVELHSAANPHLFLSFKKKVLFGYISWKWDFLLKNNV